MELLDPFTPISDQLRYLVVAIDCFTKWTGAEALARIIATNILKFFKNNMFVRFIGPQSVVTDDGTQFIDEKFQRLMEELKIKQHFSSVKHHKPTVKWKLPTRY